MSQYVLSLDEIDHSQIALVGGKAANLGELARMGGVRVPPGFCVTTGAFRRVMGAAPALDGLLDQLSRLQPGDLEAVRDLTAGIRRTIEAIAIPDDLARDILAHLSRLGENTACALRSSATAEDLPTASFAGQQDTYLNVSGPDAILRHIRRCWASLFTERAVTYRIRNGIDHRSVRMAVIVQRMLFPESSGVLFTADPVTGNRRVASVEATFGLGEALVSGHVNADVFKVRDGAVIERSIGSKHIAILPAPAGGTREAEIDPRRAGEPALTGDQAVQLVELGRRIETHFGRPQDIEWCLVDDEFHIVQSRPITTLFPVPGPLDDTYRVYLSVGHQQMMTDAMTPLAISLYQLIAARPMVEAGGRLYVDVTQTLASPAARAGLFAMLDKAEPLTRDALQTVVDRGDILPAPSAATPPGPLPGAAAPEPIATDPAIPARLIEENRASVAALARDIQSKTGPALLDFIVADIQEMKRLLFDPVSLQVIFAAIDAAAWLDARAREWLGDPDVSAALSQSAPNNVTSEMGLALLDVADAIRPFPEVVAFLRTVTNDDFLDELTALPGGPVARDAIRTFLVAYGMRGPGEIDIAKPRWSEHPSALLPLILGNIDHFLPGEHARRLDNGLRAAFEKERELLRRVRGLPDGEDKAEEMKRTIDRLRTFIGYREYPKYGWVARYSIYKKALLEEAGRLVAANVIREPDDIFFLSLPELQEAVHSGSAANELIARRKEAFATYAALTPPRVLTSEGEAISGAYRRGDLPPGALAGLPVSAGIVEGRARVVLDMSNAALEPGDILVTVFTDPSWTPLFVTVAGLITEVGGLMTHGAVIAREYGLPAIVGVEHATRLIPDGTRIRLNAISGHIELLPCFP